MLLLRATQKVLKHLPSAAEAPGKSDTALGDWFVNRLVVDRKPLLLTVSAKSLLASLVPARDVRGLPSRLATILEERLKRLGVAEELVEAEARAMGKVVVAKTNDRSVLGFMSDFAKAVPFYLDERDWDEGALAVVEGRLAETPCWVSRGLKECFNPGDRAVSLLEEKWRRSEK